MVPVPTIGSLFPVVYIISGKTGQAESKNSRIGRYRKEFVVLASRETSSSAGQKSIARIKFIDLSLFSDAGLHGNKQQQFFLKHSFNRRAAR